MRMLAALFVAAIAAGCAATPANMMQSPPQRFESSLPPAQAAGCLVARAQNHGAPLAAEAHLVGEAWEVTVRNGEGLLGPNFVMRIEPSGAGSTILFWHHLVTSNVVDSFVAEVPLACK